MAHLSLSPPLQALQSPSIAGSCCTCSGGGHDVGSSTIGVEDIALQKLALDIEGLLAQGDDYSDAIIIVEGVPIPIHRCILAVRSPFFRIVFSKRAIETKSMEEGKDLPPSAEKDRYDLSQIVTSGRVGYKTFIVVLNYFYGGNLKGLDEACAVSCMDTACPHVCCWPFVDTYLEILCAASVFDIPELKDISQQNLVKVLEKVQIEHVLQIVLGAWTHGATVLLDLSVQILVQSNIEAITLEKQLPMELSHRILRTRLKLGFPEADAHCQLHEKQCKRVYKALDSDDVELVQLLLKEAKLTMDSAYALHFAATYCDSKTIAELLDLGMADINCKDRRGFTILHVATFRRDPEIIGSLLEKGANPLDLTPDGQTALQISKRLTRLIEPNGRAEPREDVLRDKICVEILEQADKINPLSVFPVVGEKELYMRLLYLENRAQLLFPREAKVVLGLSHVSGTREFTGIRTGDGRQANMDLNEEPSNSLHSDSESVELSTCMDETLIQRVEALQRAVEVGQRFFPRCIAILNKFMDEDSFEHACIQDRRIPEVHVNKKQCVVENSGIKVMFAEAFRKDIAAMDQQNSGKSDLLLASAASSSSSSSSPGVDICKDNPCTKLS
ncbi:hypothetical protein O6H91_01G078200 [Diphasiastrum complanatum]|uniref:Uncharacterized protein n=1 Tax=Diphasiastrum complanatum TaxID=34168 RepID=A0ACC2ESM4_DIPCM|nr:hypothetical protein O6H91_01G078200 [Diphasiastrum complanatum]